MYFGFGFEFTDYKQGLGSTGLVIEISKGSINSGNKVTDLIVQHYSFMLIKMLFA